MLMARWQIVANRGSIHQQYFGFSHFMRFEHIHMCNEMCKSVKSIPSKKWQVLKLIALQMQKLYTNKSYNKLNGDLRSHSVHSVSHAHLYVLQNVLNGYFSKRSG